MATNVGPLPREEGGPRRQPSNRQRPAVNRLRRLHRHPSPAPQQQQQQQGQQQQSAPTVGKRLLQLLGPGLITGAADDDPTGLATYAQAGAQSGYKLLWTCVLTVPMMMAVQYTAAKVAVVHGKGLTETLKERYPKAIASGAVIALLIANLINAGSDIGAIGAAFALVLPVPAKVMIIPVVVALFFFLLLGNYNLIQNTFKWLCLALLAYIVAAFLSHPSLGGILHGTFIPTISFNPAYLALLVAALGGNVSPYLLFWQADMELDDTRQIRQAPTPRLRRRMIGRELKEIALDTNIGMIFSNIIIFFIEISTAAALFGTKAGGNIATAAQAAQALRPLLGVAAPVTWAVGMLGAALLAVPALTASASDAVAALFGWPHGLNDTPRRAKRFYLVLAIALGIGVAINFVGINPIQALIIAAVVNGIITPPLLVLLLLIARRKDVMGTHTNGKGISIVGWATVAIMSLAALGFLITTF